MISFESGDIFATPNPQALAHGCNCFGAMGAGIAVEFKKRWPAMYNIYRDDCLRGYFKPGDVYMYTPCIETDPKVFNLATQDRFQAKIGWINTAIITMLRQARVHNITEILMPAIGCGLGGLDWREVKNLLQTFDSSDVNLRVCETYRKGVAMYVSTENTTVLRTSDYI